LVFQAAAELDEEAKDADSDEEVFRSVSEIVEEVDKHLKLLHVGLAELHERWNPKKKNHDLWYPNNVKCVQCQPTPCAHETLLCTFMHGCPALCWWPSRGHVRFPQATRS
jgi:hypothetical protein